MSDEPIRGKVARILNSRELVMNVGTSQGVEVGMHFDVMDQKGLDITDPETEELLGSVERPKVRVKVTTVKEKLAVASTYRETRVNVGGSGLDFSGLVSKTLMPAKWVTRFETFKTDQKTWEDLEEHQSYVKIGDPVVQVLTEREE